MPRKCQPKRRRPRVKLYPDLAKTVTRANRITCGKPTRIAKTRAVIMYLSRAAAFEATAAPPGARSKAATRQRISELNRLARTLRSGVRKCNLKALAKLRRMRAKGNMPPSAA